MRAKGEARRGAKQKARTAPNRKQERKGARRLDRKRGRDAVRVRETMRELRRGRDGEPIVGIELILSVVLSRGRQNEYGDLPSNTSSMFASPHK